MFLSFGVFSPLTFLGLERWQTVDSRPLAQLWDLAHLGTWTLGRWACATMRGRSLRSVPFSEWKVNLGGQHESHHNDITMTSRIVVKQRRTQGKQRRDQEGTHKNTPKPLNSCRNGNKSSQSQRQIRTDPQQLCKTKFFWTSKKSPNIPEPSTLSKTLARPHNQHYEVLRSFKPKLRGRIHSALQLATLPEASWSWWKAVCPYPELGTLWNLVELRGTWKATRPGAP